MKITTPFLLIFAILSLSACIKSHTPDNKTYIRGYLLEYGTETPLANVKMHLGSCEGEILGSIYCSVMDSLYTDQNGYFDYETDLRSIDICTFESVEGYYPIGDYAINIGENEFNQYADPQAWIELHIKNINPVDASDKFRFTHEYGTTGWEELLGSTIDETTLLRIKGNHNSYLIWKVTKDNVTTEYRDTFPVTAHDTLYYEIFY